MKTIKVMVILEDIRVNDPDDEEEVLAAVKEKFEEDIEDEVLDFNVEEEDEDSFG